MVFELEINIYGDEPIGKFVKESETQFEITREKLGVIMTEKEYQELAGGGVTMHSKLASAIFQIDGLKVNFSELNTKYDKVSGQYTALNSKVAEYKADVDGLSADLTAVNTKLEKNYSTTTVMNAAIKASVDGLSSTVSKTYATKNQLTNYSTTSQMNSAISQKVNEVSVSVGSRVTALESWKKEASVKITDSSIVSTVRASASYKSDLSGKVNNSELTSKIEQWYNNVTVTAAKINLNGLVTANGYFKILTNGAMEATAGKIAGWKIASTYIQSANGDMTLYSSGTNRLVTANNYFKILSTGAMEATAGKIGGWIIGTNNIQSLNNNIIMHSDGRIQIGNCYLGNESHAFTVRDGMHIYTGGSGFSDGTDQLKIFNLTHISSGGHLVLGQDGAQVCYSASSSKRYKDHVREFNTVDESCLYRLNPVWFLYKQGYLAQNDPMCGRPVPGLYAEEVAAVIPEAARYDEFNRPEDWNERMIIPYLIQAIKAQKREIENLKAVIVG